MEEEVEVTDEERQRVEVSEQGNSLSVVFVLLDILQLKFVTENETQDTETLSRSQDEADQQVLHQVPLN